MFFAQIYDERNEGRARTDNQHNHKKKGEEQSLILPQVVRRPWEVRGDGYLPGFRGTVTNWTLYEDALLDVLTAPDSGVHPETVGGRFLWCESSLRSPEHFGRLGEICFELLEAERFLSVDKDTLSALAISGCLLSPAELSTDLGDSSSSSSSSSALQVLRCMQHFSGLIVDLGASLSRITPILSGQALGCLAVELPLGGRDIDAFLCSSLLQQQQQQQQRQQELKQPVKVDFRPCYCAVAAARSIKEQVVCCATERGLVFAAETSLARNNPCSVRTPRGCSRCSSSSSFCSSSWPGAGYKSNTKKRRCGEGLWEAAEDTDVKHQQQLQQQQQQQLETQWLVGDCRVAAAELLFDAKTLTEYRHSRAEAEPLSALHLLPLQTAVAAVVEKCPIDTRKCLLQNVFVVGGTSLIPGVAARLQTELRELYRYRKAHASFLPRVHVLPHPELQHHAAVCGGLRFGVQHHYDLNNMTREQRRAQEAAADYSRLQETAADCSRLQLQQAAAFCSILQQIAVHRLQQTAAAADCSRLQQSVMHERQQTSVNLWHFKATALSFHDARLAAFHEDAAAAAAGSAATSASLQQQEQEQLPQVATTEKCLDEKQQLWAVTSATVVVAAAAAAEAASALTLLQCDCLITWMHPGAPAAAASGAVDAVAPAAAAAAAAVAILAAELPSDRLLEGSVLQQHCCCAAEEKLLLALAQISIGSNSSHNSNSKSSNSNMSSCSSITATAATAAVAATTAVAAASGATAATATKEAAATTKSTAALKARAATQQ
ncbi:hypothetical protein, conserved [Eimeria tenella]|uniref:Uncharacterized protein n=1 Tax=Eimeria tenella TaxID=5802 RepID=U6L1F1_EIMTE|nr:hypothetical protein, conserved [Eimeria tenella]CDJ44001.1 hypothetical protein, conserved [Eimeria tenella]|eukprot:XP_013234750.1 hypothetical protein, conserved [Eimeria tenella]